jgi:hypothetical protein
VNVTVASCGENPKQPKCVKNQTTKNHFLLAVRTASAVSVFGLKNLVFAISTHPHSLTASPIEKFVFLLCNFQKQSFSGWELTIHEPDELVKTRKIWT